MLRRCTTSSGFVVTSVHDVMASSCCSYSSESSADMASSSPSPAPMKIRLEVPPIMLMEPLSRRSFPILPDNSFSNLGTPEGVPLSVGVSTPSSSPSAPSLASIDSATSSKLSHVRICLTSSGTSFSGKLRMACMRVCRVELRVLRLSISFL